MPLSYYSSQKLLHPVLWASSAEKVGGIPQSKKQKEWTCNSDLMNAKNDPLPTWANLSFQQEQEWL